MIGRPSSVLAADERQAHVRALGEELRAGRTVHRDTVALRNDGTHIDVHLTASPILASTAPTSARRSRCWTSPSTAAPSTCSSASSTTRRT